MGVTHFPHGISTAVKGSNLFTYPASDPTKVVSFFDDFIGNSMFPLGASGVGALDNANWDFDVTEAGAGNGAIAVVDGHGGLISLTCDVADNDLIFVQSKYEAWLPVAGKKMWMKSRFKVNEVIESEAFIGIYVRDTDPLSATGGDGVTDGIYFLSEDGAATFKLYCQKDTTTGQTSIACGSLVANTFLTVGFYYDGKDTLEAFVNDIKIGSTSVSAFLPDTECALGFGIKQGEITNAKVLTLDYIFMASER